MKSRIVLALSATALVVASTVAFGALAPTVASAAGSSCALKGSATFNPPLGLTTRTTTVKFTGTLSKCTSNTYGITGGTVQSSGSGPATCNPSGSNSVTTTGTIKWKGVTGTNTDTTTSTGVANSNPPTDTLSGTITGGSPVPSGTTTGGSLTYKVTKTVTKDCTKGKLQKISFTGTTTLN
jgi:hypothetical protein